MQPTDLRRLYEQKGFVSALPLMPTNDARQHRQSLEQAEKALGKLHYKPKIHTLLHSAFEIASSQAALDIVEQIIGPNILLYNATYIIKEPASEAHVSWHQDLTYWGLSHDNDVVTMWVALSAANQHSGCMQMIPGSHTGGQLQHTPTTDANNVLYQGQTVDLQNFQLKSASVAAPELCPLQPGEASFHHGWTLHASMPNQSDDRRIGLNVQYIAPHVRQLKSHRDSAMLLRGEDRHGHFGADTPAEPHLTPEAIARQRELEQRYLEIAGR